MPLCWIIVLLLLMYTVNLIKITVKEKKKSIERKPYDSKWLSMRIQKNCSKH